MNHWRRFWRIAPAYLRTVARREWQLILLALVGLAPGVATLLAWTNLAFLLHKQQTKITLSEWLLPSWLLERIGAAGVLVGVGVVTLLIGCLSLANIYVASLERRAGELALFTGLGLPKRQVTLLLWLEAVATGVLGSTVGVVLGILLCWLTWRSGIAYFRQTAAFQLFPAAVWIALAAGLTATLLFLSSVIQLHQIAAVRQGQTRVVVKLRTTNMQLPSMIGGVIAAGLMLLTGVLVLNPQTALILTLLTALVSTLLLGGAWVLTYLYRRLPTPTSSPLWTLAVQGLARHPNHTAGMTLALTAGAYSVGLAALGWLESTTNSLFIFWVALMVLAAGASLVLTAAALAALERRWEFGMLLALGARKRQIWSLILLEYAIVALGGGFLGAVMALFNWATADINHNWLLAIAIVAADLIGALISAWVGAAPVLWLVTRRRVERSLRLI